MTYPPPGPQGPYESNTSPHHLATDPFAAASGAAPPPPAPPTPKATKPWIIATTVTSIIAAASLITAIILIATGGSSDARATTQPPEAKRLAYAVTEKLCGKVDDDKFKKVVKPADEPLTSYPNLNAVQCRFVERAGEEYRQLNVTAWANDSTDEAQTNYERARGKMSYDESKLKDVDTDWDRAVMMSEDILGTSLMVQHDNLIVVVEISNESASSSTMKDVAMTMVGHILEITKTE